MINHHDCLDLFVKLFSVDISCILLDRGTEGEWSADWEPTTWHLRYMAMQYSVTYQEHIKPAKRAREHVTTYQSKSKHGKFSYDLIKIRWHAAHLTQGLHAISRSLGHACSRSSLSFEDFTVQWRTNPVKPFSFCRLGRHLPSAPWTLQPVKCMPSIQRHCRTLISPTVRPL